MDDLNLYIIMEYPVKVIPNPRPLFYFKKREIGKYFNLIEVADTNVHEQITNIVNHMYPHPIRILDIASGEGALSLRLKESRVKLKFADEFLNVDMLEPKEPLLFNYYQVDLNDESQLATLSKEYAGQFDLILGIETIEHLDNPRMYLFYLQQMLSEQGHLFISTPNINNPMTRRTFYKKGKLEQFTEQDLKESGHMFVTLPHVLESMASSVGLDLMIEYPLGLYPKFWLYPDKRSLYITLCNLRMLRVNGSWVKLYIFKNGI
jgi:2-polyprenyl-3-methyl-5-hydroxy-6-metoxy-1,4-benzoquinol methylase